LVQGSEAAKRKHENAIPEALPRQVLIESGPVLKIGRMQKRKKSAGLILVKRKFKKRKVTTIKASKHPAERKKSRTRIPQRTRNLPLHGRSSACRKKKKYKKAQTLNR